jgi:hypothetical protein
MEMLLVLIATSYLHASFRKSSFTNPPLEEASSMRESRLLSRHACRISWILCEKGSTTSFSCEESSDGRETASSLDGVRQPFAAMANPSPLLAVCL